MSLNPTSRGWRPPLRISLLISSFFIIALLLAAGFLWSRYNLWSVLISAEDDLLLRKARELVKSIPGDASRAAIEREMYREIEFYADEAMVVIFRACDNAPLILPRDPQSLAIAKHVADRNGTPNAMSLLHDNIEFRLLAVSLELDCGAGTIQLLKSTTDAHQTIQQYDRRALFGGMLLLLLVIPAALWLYRQALSPVTQAVKAARQLDPADLSARLPRTYVNDELDQLAKTFNDLLERLAFHHERVIRFTADSAHELRTPLATMRVRIEVALSQRRSADYLLDELALLGEQCERLSTIVDGLQLLAKGDAGELKLQTDRVNIDELVQKKVEFFTPVAEDRGINLVHRIPPTASNGAGYAADSLAWVDVAKIRQVLGNLLDNALKFTPTGGEIAVETAYDFSTVSITVNDTGPGIPVTALPHLFERFYRADDSRSRPGSGLGLSICKAIVESHGGTIAANNRGVGGATFKIILPKSR